MAIKKGPMFVALTWCGRAVTKNRMHTPANGRIIKTAEYRKFLADLAMSWRGRRPPVPLRPYVAEVTVCVGKLTDPQNLVDPILDALELAKIVEKDRYLARLTLDVRPAHGRGVADQIEVLVYQPEKAT
tara:strand:- start:2779 stop:3165 length:387 start_codon:yes stop_codon:yes gene_type:complete